MSSPRALGAVDVPRTPILSRRQWWSLLTISLAVSLIIVDSTIVNVAIPSIVDDLSITSTQVQWVQESYTLVFAALLLLFGALADRFGRKNLLAVGVIIFMLASVAAAIAPTGDLLILARVIQGIGGAMVLPTTLSLVNIGFTGRARAIAFAVWGSTIGGVVALGPLLGGWLTTAFTWRYAFGINIPLGALVLVGVWLAVVDARAGDEPPTRLDLGGAALSVVASASLVFGLIEGRTLGWWFSDPAVPFTVAGWEWPWAVSPVPLAMMVALVAGVSFVVRARRRERLGLPSLVSLHLFQLASFRNGNVAALIISLGEFGIILALPLWLQNVVGYDALQTGLVLLGLALGSFVASGLSAGLTRRFSPVLLVRIGIGAEILGVAGLALVLRPDSGWTSVVPLLFVYGIGVGLATAQLTGVILRDVPERLSGQGSGTQSTARQVGSALGIAILGTVLFTATGAVLDARIAERQPGLDAAARASVVDGVVVSAGASIPALRAQDPELGAEAAEAFTDGTRLAAGAASAFLLVGFAATFGLRANREGSVAAGAGRGSERNSAR